MIDAHTLQSEIDKFIQWCKDNYLEVNLSKCKIITYTRKKTPIVFNYTINGTPIERVDIIRDLGVMMDAKLNFNAHIEYIKKKAMLILGFVKRQCRLSFNTDVAVLLYNALVRSIVEFASCIWSPYNAVNRNSIESIQRQAIIFILRDNINRKENNYVLPPYLDRCNQLSLQSLSRRRINSAILFIHKLIIGKFNSPQLRDQLNINSGIRTIRNPEFIRLPRCKTNHTWNSSFYFACRAFNMAALFLDPTLPHYQFREKLLRIPDKYFDRLFET